MWILMIALMWPGNDKTSMMNVQLNTKEACIAAADDFEKKIHKSNPNLSVIMSCVNKGYN